MPKISQYAQDTSPADSDYVIGNQASPLATKIFTFLGMSSYFSTKLSTDWQAISATLTYSSYSAPTGVISTSTDLTGSIGVGMRLQITQSSTVQFAIVTKITSSAITAYFGTDYSLANSTISSPSYSQFKAPIGFPLDPTKWTVTTSNTGNCAKTSPAQNTWYGDTGLSVGGPSIALPIGAWTLSYSASFFGTKGSVTSYDIFSTLSTASNSASDSDFTVLTSWNGASGTVGGIAYVNRSKSIAVASATTYYLNVMTDIASSGTIGIRGDLTTTLIRAVCAYL